MIESITVGRVGQEGKVFSLVSKRWNSLQDGTGKYYPRVLCGRYYPALTIKSYDFAVAKQLCIRKRSRLNRSKTGVTKLFASSKQ